MAGKRLLFYPELREEAQEIVGPYWKIGRDDQQEISTLSDMVKQIDKQKSLDELVIFLHGYTGGMMLDDDDGNSKGYDLGEQAVTQAFAKTKTQSWRLIPASAPTFSSWAFTITRCAPTQGRAPYSPKTRNRAMLGTQLSSTSL